jgi:hypothetical protein
MGNVLIVQMFLTHALRRRINERESIVNSPLPIQNSEFLHQKVSDVIHISPSLTRLKNGGTKVHKQYKHLQCLDTH